MINTTKHPGGRPSEYANTDAGYQAFEQMTRRFLEDLQDNRFSVKRWADYLGVTRQTLYNYINRGHKWHVLYMEVINK